VKVWKFQLGYHLRFEKYAKRLNEVIYGSIM
jgi:hypothetical protein